MTPPVQARSGQVGFGAVEGATSVNDGRLMTAEEVAERWQVPKSQVYRLTRIGELPTIPLGRHYRYRLSTIVSWEAAREGRADG